MKREEHLLFCYRRTVRFRNGKFVLTSKQFLLATILKDYIDYISREMEIPEMAKRNTFEFERTKK